MKVYTNKPKLLKTEIFDEALKLTENDVPCVSMGVRFVSRHKIKKLNAMHRDINKVTDVLSFPMFDTKRKHTLASFESERDPITKELEIGDIVICTHVARLQARKHKHSFEREVNFLALHGLLHLLGYDHMTPRDEKQMFSLAESILSAAGLKRGENV